MDKLDMKILSSLLNNCRESDRQIGKSLGIGGGAIKSRIQKMIESGVIESFTLRIDPTVLGYEVFYIVITGQRPTEILEQISLIGKPFVLVPCVGGITVCGILVEGNVTEKIELTKKIMRDVRVLSIFQSDNAEYSSNLTKTDLQVIEELLKNPREKIENIAKNTNLSTKTIARTIEKIQRNNLIQFTTIYDPTKISGFIPYAILTWIKGQINHVLKKFEKEFSDSFLQIPFIAKNQIVLFLYSDDIYKLDETTQRIRDLPYVEAVDLFIPKKITFPRDWIDDVIKKAKSSPTFHINYNSN